MRRPARHPVRLAAAGAAALALTAVGVVGAAPAHAGPPGTWTTLGNTGVASITQPTTLRLGTTLTVGWTIESGATQSILTRTVSAAGAAGSAQTALSGWSSLSYDPKLLPSSAGRQVVFGGIRSTAGGEQYNGSRIYRASGSSSWTLAPATTFPTSQSAYGGYGYGAVQAPGGRTIVAYTLNSTVYLSDDAGNTATLTVPGGKTGYNTNLVRDSATGATWVVIYVGDNDATAATKTGVWAQQLNVTSAITPVGGWARQPGSVSKTQFGWNALNPIQDVPVAAPSGGGAYVAYGMGYPTATYVRIQRLGSSSGITVKAAGADVRQVSLASSGSRLWVSWAKPGSIWATRTNTAKSRIGAVRHLGTPGKDATVYHLASDGATGRLDLLVTAQAYPKPIAVSHTQVLAGLSVSLSKAKIKASKGGKEVVTVTDAGAAVAGAKVTIGKKTKTTKANGTAKFKVKKGSSTGKRTVSATAGGYAAGSASFTVT